MTTSPVAVKSFAGYAADGIVSEAGVEDGVGNLVGDLVGMAFRYGFGSKKVTILWQLFLLNFARARDCSRGVACFAVTAENLGLLNRSRILAIHAAKAKGPRNSRQSMPKLQTRMS